MTRNILATTILISLCFSVLPVQAQQGFSFDIKKPREYDDRVLGSEKSENKKFSLPRRFIQNTFTHYNYFFNANNKLNEVLEIAKQQHVDDYTELLSFYNYSLDITAQNRIQLDSIIYKSNTGIVLHDLRNDWIDNLYLLTGAAYFLRKQFDSAYLTFQFINYAFAEKEKDGYYKNIGSNLDGNNTLSISTKEKNSLPKKIFSQPPSRNDAFIWQIRTLIVQNEYAESAGLIVALKNDPLFPKRLQPDLEEVEALWYYRNNMFDSAAFHLSKALSNATTKIEKARWEFLIAQLYELSNKPDLAKTFYEKVISHTTDPVMEIYARLHSIKINKDGGENYINRNIVDLLKMANRDKYSDYRDIIYFTIAQMEMERGDFSAAQKYLSKSAEFNTTNLNLKNKAWLQLAELAFNQKKYRIASDSYDSLNLNDPLLKDIDNIVARKKLLNKIATHLEIIDRQDSLQTIAEMPENERKDFVKRVTRQLRKEQGLKEETGILIPIGAGNQNIVPDLFNTATGKGEWYFYNAALRSQGISEFKAKWGVRANTDNWRRASAINITQKAQALTAADIPAVSNIINEPTEITFESLYNKLPLTEELLMISNDSIKTSLFILGKSMAEEVEDCNSSIQVLEELRMRFPLFEKMDEVLFTLYYCYTKSSQAGKATAAKKVMEEKYPGNPLTTIVTTGKDPRNIEGNPEASKTYEQIYDLFIEGKFGKAIEEKAKADAQYGSHYWTPQLLYIESVYYIRQKQDSLANASLKKITETFPGTVMAEKANTLIEVLSRREAIEQELRAMQVVRPAEDVIRYVDTAASTIPAKVVNVPQPPAIVKADTLTQQPKKQELVAVIPKTVETKTDSILSKPAVAPFVYKPNDKYSVMIFLTNIDMVWMNETKNAFNIYNRGKYFNRQFNLSITDINGEYKALLIGSFDNAQAALDYVAAAKPLSNTQIVPWLKSDRYSFSIISDENLELLKSNKEVNTYKQFIEKNLPGKF